MLRILVVGLLVLVAVMFMIPHRLHPRAATELPAAKPLPAFALLDQDARPFSNANLQGRLSLLYFGYTRCPAVCTRTLRTLAAVHGALEKRLGAQAPQFVFVSVDTRRDTPGALRDYLRPFDAAIVGVTARDAGALRSLTDALGVPVGSSREGAESYRVVADATVYVIGAHGGLIALFDKSADARTMAGDVLKIRAKHLGPAPAGHAQPNLAAL